MKKEERCEDVAIGIRIIDSLHVENDKTINNDDCKSNIKKCLKESESFNNCYIFQLQLYLLRFDSEMHEGSVSEQICCFLF